MKCELCNKTIMAGSHYTDGEEHYCSPECAMKENGIMRVSKRLCTHCKTEIGLQSAYADEGDDLFCSMECALAANGITKRAK
ncbi:MAG: hypothetical protein J5622_01945 [Firmicutes bacterium]|nr:hypothetical protein [Bacillota bacterium]